MTLPRRPPPLSAAPRFKVGASLLLPFSAFNDEAALQAADLSNADVQSRLCADDGREAMRFAVHWTDRARGQFVLSPPGNGTTAGLRPGRYRLDVALTLPGAAPGGAPLVLCSESLGIELIASETLR